MIFIKEILGLFVYMILRYPWLLLLCIGVTVLCCIIACSAKTTSAIIFPVVIITALFILSLSVLYYIVNVATGLELLEILRKALSC